MKLILAFIAAIVLLSSVPDITRSQPQKSRSAAAARKRKLIKRGTKKVVEPKPSPIGTTPSGLIYVITRHGEGRQPKPGDTVSVHYTGLLTNGVKFDSSLDRGNPISFELGVGRVIKGWDEGIAKLHVGDQATLVIPSSLGYGAKGIGPIPPDATLVFIVELVAIQEKVQPN
ncbi:MAG TPA: FKBP-type peptidyl-prolyl cis-trans isomerase [Pyrinomonadaceae bacterium]|nr:FKBP-type peptidyl-prolyl cis-trans isomerase [Pyrinomonadaceae bacterium]